MALDEAPLTLGNPPAEVHPDAERNAALEHAFERQHLFGALESAAGEAALNARRWQVLADVATLLTSSEDPSSLTAELAALVVPAGADAFVLHLTGEDEAEPVLIVRVAQDPEGDRARRARRLIEQAGDLAGLLPDEPTVDATAAEPFRTLLVAIDLPSGTVAPLRVERSRGFLLLGPARTTSDVLLCRALADRITVGLVHARHALRTARAVAGRDRAFEIVAHDLGSPLSAVRICASALLDPRPPPLDGIHDMAKIILRSAEWMQNILHDLVDRASLDSGRLALDRAPTDVCELTAAARAMFEPVAEEEEVMFVVVSPPQLPRIDADSRRMLQVLLNLLHNAIKFTPAGGLVVLSAALVEEFRQRGLQRFVRFTVSDTGPGIADEDVPHVFDWYWHTAKGRGGSGIGLAIAQGLVEAHGSHIEVESAPERGSSFWFTIPVAPDATRPDIGRMQTAG